jgi:HME family heavy-metal exporter
MNAAGVELAEVEDALRGFGTNTGGGFVDQYDQEFLIRNVARTTRIEDLRALVVADGPGGPVACRRSPPSTTPPPSGAATPAMAACRPLSSLSRSSRPPLRRGTEQVETALAEIGAGLPAGMRATRVQFRQADFIETSIGTLTRVLIEAAIVVAAVLFLFLLNVRTDRDLADLDFPSRC